MMTMIFGFIELALLLKASPSDRRPLELALSSLVRCSAVERLPCDELLALPLVGRCSAAAAED
jgi:hypothetical protein